jgi:hypothetical protein
MFQDEFGPELETSMAKARDLMITGVTRNTLISRYYSKLEDLLREGCRIRLVLVDPSSDGIVAAADRYYAERSPDRTRARVRHTLRLLTELRRSTNGEISVRLTSHPLSMGLIAVDANAGGRTDASSLFVEYYEYQAPGAPKFVLRPIDGKWFDEFHQEAEALWASATEYLS